MGQGAGVRELEMLRVNEGTERQKGFPRAAGGGAALWLSGYEKAWRCPGC